MADAVENLKKERDSLLKALESEDADIKKLETYLNDLKFQKLQDGTVKKWTAEAFLKRCSK